MNVKKEILYPSNVLSLSRFVLLGITIYFLLSSFTNKYLLACFMIVVIWISDLLDGYIARKKNQISELGKIIDPLADKVCVISIIIVLVLQGAVPLWFSLIIIFRDIIIFSGGLYIKKFNNQILQSNWVGKISVFIIGLTLFFIIFFSHFKLANKQIFLFYHTENLELFLKFLIILSMAMTILSLFVYMKRFFSIVNKKNIF